MKHWTVLPLAVCALATPPVSDDAEVLREADRAFCAETTERGLGGWLAWFAPDAVVATPGGELRNGAEEIAAYYGSLAFPPPGFSWAPDGAGLAGSGELGFTVGAWEIRPPGAKPDAPTSGGRYLTVWRRQPDETFRVVADLGGDVDFRTRVAEDAGPALEWACTTERFEVAESGELAFALGSWSARAEHPETGAASDHEGRYLSVWRRAPEGAWTVVGEIGFENQGPR